MKGFSSGITLIEVIVTIFIVAIFSTILISGFPKIEREFALSRAAYNLSQDLRRAEDMGLSGVKIKDSANNPIPAKGYGIYIDESQNTAYVLYADTCLYDVSGWKHLYTTDTTDASCIAYGGHDYVISNFDLNVANDGVYIYKIEGTSAGITSDITGRQVSVNFVPPNPYIFIADNTYPTNSDYTGISIELALKADGANPTTVKTVSVNNSGLITVK